MHKSKKVLFLKTMLINLHTLSLKRVHRINFNNQIGQYRCLKCTAPEPSLVFWQPACVASPAGATATCDTVCDCLTRTSHESPTPWCLHIIPFTCMVFVILPFSLPLVVYKYISQPPTPRTRECYRSGKSWVIGVRESEWPINLTFSDMGTRQKNL